MKVTPPQQNGSAAEGLDHADLPRGPARARSASSSAPVSHQDLESKLTGAPLVVKISAFSTDDLISKGRQISVQTSIMMISDTGLHTEEFVEGQLNKTVKVLLGIFIDFNDSDMIEQA